MIAISHHHDHAQVLIWFFAWQEKSAISLLNVIHPGLSLEEREQGSKFPFAEDQQAYWLAHILLPRALSQHHPGPELAWHFSRDKNGTTCIGSPRCGSLFFSVGHRSDRESYGQLRGVELSLRSLNLLSTPDALPTISFPCSEDSSGWHFLRFRPTGSYLMAVAVQVQVAPKP